MTLRCFGDQLYTGLTRPDPSRSLKTPFYIQVFFPNLIFFLLAHSEYRYLVTMPPAWINTFETMRRQMVPTLDKIEQGVQQLKNGDPSSMRRVAR